MTPISARSAATLSPIAMCPGVLARRRAGPVAGADRPGPKRPSDGPFDGGPPVPHTRRSRGAPRESERMNMNIGGWSVTGVVALIAIIAGVVLLVVYAARRGFVNNDLD